MKPFVHWSVRTWLGRLLLAMPVAQVLNLSLVPDLGARQALSNLLRTAAAVLGAVALTRAAVWLRREGYASATGWAMVAAANWAFVAGAFGFMYLEVVRRVYPYPGFPDIFYLGFYPIMITGLVLLPLEPVSRRERWNNVIDLAAYALVVAMVIWHINLRHLLAALATGPHPGVRLSIYYSLLDALLLMMLFFRLERRLGGGREFVPMLLLIIGGFFLIAADQIQGYMVTREPFASGSPVDIGWLAFSTMAGMAGVCIVACTGADVAPEHERLDVVRTFWTIGITYVWIGMVFAMLIWALFHPGGVSVGLLVAGVVGGTVLAVTRQVRTLREMARLYERLRGAHGELEVAVRARTAELRASEQRFRAIFHSAYELIGLLAPDGTLLEVNETVLRLMGARREDIVGRPFWETPLWSHSQEARDRLREAVGRAASGEMHRGEEDVLTSDGRRRARIDVTLKPVFDDEGRVVMIIPEGYDVTERKVAEEERGRLLLREQDARRQAEHASAAKDRFIAVLSHELRTPLTPVLMTLNVWREEGVIAESHREDLEMLIRNIQLEARMIDDLLDTTRVARGKLHLVRSACDLGELVRETAEMFRGNEGAAIEVEMPPGRVVVDADPVRVRQVVWNFLSNARKFTPREGRITVRTGVREGEAWVSVADNGVGIPAEQMAGLFDAFVQGAGHGVRPQGLGLGLAISRAIARAHGGDVTCASDGAGKGAEFVLRLPALRGEAAPPVVAEPRESAAMGNGAKTRGEGRSILLVEDHPDTARVLARLLSAAGYEVRRAHSLAEARRELEGWTPDLVVSDLGLPDGSGHELMREVRARGGGIRGIAVSGFGTMEDVRQSEEAGFSRHLTKPVTPAALLEAIGEMLHGVAP